MFARVRSHEVAGHPAGGRSGRKLLAALGMVSVALGVVGIFVPGMPTTVFLLIASYLFARGSPDLYRRLHAHPKLGAYLRMAEGGAMPVRAKVVALAGLWTGLGLSLFLVGPGKATLSLGLVSLGAIGTAVILFLAGRYRADAAHGLGED